MTGGTLAVGGVVVAGPPRLAASAAQSAAQDAEIFKFALLLEYTQAAFYAEAVERDQIPASCSSSRRPSPDTSARK